MISSLVGIIASSGGVAGGDYESIATTTVGAGGAATITFSSIPSTYQHLQIRGIGRSNRSAANDEMILRYNSDNGANYATHRLYGDGSSTGSQGFTSQSYALIGDMPAASGLSNTFATTVVDVLDYANTNKNTTTRILAGRDENGTGYLWFNSNLWLNTSAVSTITILPANGTGFVQYSQFALYGIKG